MKRALLFSVISALGFSSFAQDCQVRMTDFSTLDLPQTAKVLSHGTQQKTTALGDTLNFATNEQRTTGIRAYYDYAQPFDSGYVYGTNVVGWKGFAELYSLEDMVVTPGDTTFNVIGCISGWGGPISANSTKTVTFSVWPQSTAKSNLRTKYYIYGMPTAAPLTTSTVNAKSLNLSQRNTVYFSTPVTGTSSSFYLGYTLSNYTWASTGADTFGLLRITDASKARTNYYHIEQSTGDTLLEPNSIIQDASGTWKATRHQAGVGNAADLVIYPVFRFNCPNCFPTSIKGITNKGLTIFGTYPNPAVNNMNVRFALEHTANINILIMDATGRTINTIQKSNMAAGEHTVNIETANLASGNYIIAFESGSGSMALQFTVAK